MAKIIVPDFAFDSFLKVFPMKSNVGYGNQSEIMQLIHKGSHMEQIVMHEILGTWMHTNLSYATMRFSNGTILFWLAINGYFITFEPKVQPNTQYDFKTWILTSERKARIELELKQNWVQAEMEIRQNWGKNELKMR